MPKSLYIDPVKVREPGYIHFEDIPVCQYNKTIKQELEEGNYTKEDLIRIYRDMAICREFEHMLTLIKTQANYNGVETTYPGPAHLSLGQEASCVGEAYLLTKDDITFGSHRSHSEILSKGLSCINKLSDEELMSTMENFLGGKTLAAVKKFADTSDVKELAIRFLLYGTVAEIFARENGFHQLGRLIIEDGIAVRKQRVHRIFKISRRKAFEPHRRGDRKGDILVGRAGVDDCFRLQKSCGSRCGGKHGNSRRYEQQEQKRNGAQAENAADAERRMFFHNKEPPL